MNTTPLMTQSRSNAKCDHSVMLMRFGSPLVLRGPSLLRTQVAGGRVCVRTSQPERMISTIRNMLKKCCQPSHAGNPTGAPSGRWVSPG